MRSSSDVSSIVCLACLADSDERVEKFLDFVFAGTGKVLSDFSVSGRSGMLSEC